LASLIRGSQLTMGNPRHSFGSGLGLRTRQDPLTGRHSFLLPTGTPSYIFHWFHQFYIMSRTGFSCSCVLVLQLLWHSSLSTCIISHSDHPSDPVVCEKLQRRSFDQSEAQGRQSLPDAGGSPDPSSGCFSLPHLDPLSLSLTVSTRSSESPVPGYGLG